MTFNFETISIASNNLYHSDDENQISQASQFLISWQDSEGSEMLALEILTNSNMPLESKFVSSSIIRSFLAQNKFSTLNPEIQANFRQQIIESILSNHQHDKITKNLIPSLISVSLLEWPENWTTFPFDLYPQPANHDDVTFIQFYIDIFNELITQILESNLINSQRRIFLINTFLASIDQVFSMILPSLTITNHNGPFLKQLIGLLSNILKISPIELFVNDIFIGSILLAIEGENENLIFHEEMLKFAEDLLLKHPGKKNLIEIFAKPILLSASHVENQSTALSSFLIHYLTKYAQKLLELAMSIDDNGEMIFLLSQQYLATLKSPLINTSDIYDIWNLWLPFFRNDTFETKNGEINSPLFERIPFDQIIDPIFHLLLLSSNEGFIKQKVVYKTITAFFEDFRELTEILVSSPPISEVCLFYGLIWSSMEEEKEIECALNFYQKVFQMDSEFFVQTPSVLFALSFCQRFLSKNQQAQQSLSILLGQLIDHDGLLEPISRALNQISQKVPQVFLVNNEMLFLKLMSNLHIILQKGKNGIRIFKSLCWLSMSAFDEQRKTATFEILASHVLELMNSLDSVYLALQCLKVQPNKSSLFVFVFNKLLDLNQILFMRNIPIQIVDGYLMSLSKAFVSFPFESIKDVFLNFIQEMASNEMFEHQIFYLIEVMTAEFSEMVALQSLILTNLVFPYLEKHLDDGQYFDLDSEYFEMIQTFSPDVLTIPQIVQTFAFGIRDLRRDVVKSSCNALKNLMNKLNYRIPQLLIFVQTYRRIILHSLLSALFDMLHSSSFSPHSKLLAHFFDKCSYLTSAITASIGSIPPELAENPVNDVEIFSNEFCQEISLLMNLDINTQVNLDILLTLFSQLLATSLKITEFKDILKSFLIDAHITTNGAIMTIEEQADKQISKSFNDIENTFIDEDDLQMKDLAKKL